MPAVAAALPLSQAHAAVTTPTPSLTTQLQLLVVDGGLRLLVGIIILVVGWMLATWAKRGLQAGLARIPMDLTLKPLIASMARYVILVLTLLLVVQQFGVQTTSLIAVLGAAGLAIGLALQGTLSNVASGVMLLFLRPFRVFDKIRIADTNGMVREIGLFRTEIVTDDGNYVSIPNSTIFSGTIVNVSREAQRRTNFTIEIDRGENLDRVQKVILEALDRLPQVTKAPAPIVEVDTLGPLSTTLTVHAWVQNRDFLATLSELKKRVRHALNDAEIIAPIPVPPPAVAPWQPPTEQEADNRANKPN